MDDFRTPHSFPGLRSRGNTVSSSKSNYSPKITSTSNPNSPQNNIAPKQRSRTDPTASEKEKDTSSHHHHHLSKRLQSTLSSNRHAHSHSKHNQHTSPASPKDPNTRRSHDSKRKDASGSSAGSRSYGRAAKDTVQSAIELKPPISFDKILGRSGHHHHHKDTQSRKDEETLAREEEEEAARKRRERERQKREDAARAAAYAVGKANADREEVLRGELERLEAKGMQATRELDETLYGILEKAAVLRATVGQLQQLCVESQEGREQFETEGKELETTTKEALESFGGFGKQEDEVGELVKRLETAQDRTQGLNERLEDARQRVEAYERREREGEKRRRRWWGLVWTVLGLVGSLVVAVVVGRNHAASRMRLVALGEGVEERAGPVRPVVEGVVEAVGRLGNASGIGGVGAAVEEDDPVLEKMFGKL